MLLFTSLGVSEFSLDCADIYLDVPTLRSRERPRELVTGASSLQLRDYGTDPLLRMTSRRKIDSSHDSLFLFQRLCVISAEI